MKLPALASNRLPSLKPLKQQIQGRNNLHPSISQ
jgi:hypothetical protein